MKRSGGRPTMTGKSHNKAAKTYTTADRERTTGQKNVIKTGRSIASYFVNPSARSDQDTTAQDESMPSTSTAVIATDNTPGLETVDMEGTIAPTRETETDELDLPLRGLPLKSTEKRDKFKDKLITFSRKFPWPEYRYGEGAYCVVCKATSLSSDKVKVWSTRPHNLLKDDKWNINFNKHQQTKLHKENTHVLQMVKKWKASGKGGIQAQVQERVLARKESDRSKNRKLLTYMLKSLLFLVQKRWAARENYEDFLRFIGDHLEHQSLQQHFSVMKKNATYMSKTTVENFLQHIDSYLEDELLTTLKSVSYITLETDESTSESGNEMLSIYVNFMHPITYTLEEKFLCQVKMGTSKTAKALHQSITQVLKDKEIYVTKIFFAGMDTTNTMSGERGGLQRLLRHSSPMCKYQPCRSHKLALVLVHMMKTNTLLSEMDSLLIAVWKKFKFSTNNKAVLEEAQTIEGSKSLKVISNILNLLSENI